MVFLETGWEVKANSAKNAIWGLAAAAACAGGASSDSTEF
jgi:hypothetical protein